MFIACWIGAISAGVFTIRQAPVMEAPCASENALPARRGSTRHDRVAGGKGKIFHRNR
jgi:hypothetical protein